MKNFIQSGHRLPFTAAADTLSGAVVVIGEYVGVNSYDVLTGEEGELSLTGVVSIPKNVGTAFSQGDNAYQDIADDEVNADNLNPLAGTVHKAALSADTHVEVLLKGGPAAGMH